MLIWVEQGKEPTDGYSFRKCRLRLALDKETRVG
jgi:hypothetical protein